MGLGKIFHKPHFCEGFGLLNALNFWQFATSFDSVMVAFLSKSLLQAIVPLVGIGSGA